MRAERRRAFGFEELSPPEIAPSSVKVSVQFRATFTRSVQIFPSALNFYSRFRLRSCTWTSAPRWTLRVTETAVHVRYPPTAPGSPPTQRCRTLHVSHPLFPWSANSVNSRSAHTKTLHLCGCRTSREKLGFSVLLTLCKAANNTTPAAGALRLSLAPPKKGEGGWLFFEFKIKLQRIKHEKS